MEDMGFLSIVLRVPSEEQKVVVENAIKELKEAWRPLFVVGVEEE